MPELVDSTAVDRTMSTYRRATPRFVSGEGAWITDENGTRYLDWISGIGASCLGHGHPGLSDALGRQAATLGHVSNLYRHEPGEELSRRLCERTGMDAVFFCNSGSEANEAALKLARKHHASNGRPDRQSFVALKGGFHGRTFGSLSVTSNDAYRKPFGAGLRAVFVEPEDTDVLARALRDEPAALILEPVQGEGGIRTLSNDYLRIARELCDATGTVLVHDEIQSGGGRTGTYLASEPSGIMPDVVTLAKPLGAGLPIGATLARGPFAETLVPGDHGSTFGGGPFACRAALVVLDELDAGLQSRVVHLGAMLTLGLEALVDRHAAVTSRRGRGLMQGVTVPGHASEVVARLFGRGLLTCTAAGDVVRFLPPYVLTDDDLNAGLATLDAVLSDGPWTDS